MSATLPLVPVPMSVHATGGARFAVTARTEVVAGCGTEQAAALVARALGEAGGFVVPVRSATHGSGRAGDERAGDERAGDERAGDERARDERAHDEQGGDQQGGDGTTGLVVLALSDEDVPPQAAPAREAYTLHVAADGVSLTAGTLDGLHRAAATLRQLLLVEDGAVTIPAVRVQDAPRYAWRGLSLDVARHFLPASDLETIVDLLADYKLNVLHLHLTDDQGWRVDLPSRPELAARSSGGAVGGDPGGCYSGADWAALVGYAAGRGVTVVPEIDVPGHVNAALHAVAALSPGGEAPPEYHGTEVGFSSLRSDLPETGAFLADVFGDLAALTPGAYLHLGGDEAHHTAPQEYVALVGAALAAVRTTGKTVVGWQEVAAAPLPPGTVVQLWDPRADVAPVLRAARAGARVLMSPGDRVYLDMQYMPGFPLGQDWAGYVELRDSYDWDPAAYVPGLDPAAVVGVEAAVWTETLRTLDDVTTMLLPRLAAVAEVAWSLSGDWEGFRRRVAAHAGAWDRAGLAWYPSPQVAWRR